MTVARVPAIGDEVLHQNSLGNGVPAVILSVNGTVCDLFVNDPRAPANQVRLAVAQDLTGTPAVNTWAWLGTSALAVTPGTTIAAATSGTEHAGAGKFILASGNAAFTLTNNFITTTSIVLCVKQTAETNHAVLWSVVPTSGQAVFTFSTNVAADTTCAFLVVNAA